MNSNTSSAKCSVGSTIWVASPTSPTPRKATILDFNRGVLYCETSSGKRVWIAASCAYGTRDAALAGNGNR